MMGEGGMEGMKGMEGMMGQPRKELYPSLIDLPNLSPDQRAQIERLAQERMESGRASMAVALERLSAASAKQDYAAMQEASAQLREALAQYESGLAAQRALRDGKVPSDVALQWFQRNMNLLPEIGTETPHGIFGLSWFHYITMIILIAFAVTMIWMYFHKMRRANALLSRLATATSDASLIVSPATSSVSPATTGGAPTYAPPSEPIPVSSDIAPSKSNSWSGSLRVVRIFQETPDVKTFRFVDPDGGKLPFTYLPGQFITVTIVSDGVPVRRSYTIASSPTRRDSCEITVKREQYGVVSQYLHDQVHIGDLVQLIGPSGKFTFTGQESDSLVLIAGGVGVTPMMSVIRYLTDRSWSGEIFFLFGCKSEIDIIFREEIEYLQKRHANLHVTILLNKKPDDAKSPYLSGYITKEVVTERVPAIVSRRVHICGPPPMMEAVKRTLLELEVPEENIKTEIFAGKTPPPKTSLGGANATATSAICTFARSKKTAVLPPDKTVLEASEDVGVNIGYSCRIGVCGICKTKLLSGSVTMEVQEALTDDDKAQNIILACQAKAVADVAVDA
jgi:ferredoxin-NADP reductase